MLVELSEHHLVDGQPDPKGWQPRGLTAQRQAGGVPFDRGPPLEDPEGPNASNLTIVLADLLSMHPRPQRPALNSGRQPSHITLAHRGGGPDEPDGGGHD